MFGWWYNVLMLVLLHILVAFTSMAYTAYAYISPSVSRLYASYALAGLTLSSGTVLLLQYPSHLVPACIAGLIYFGIVGAVIFATRHKLAAQENI